MRVQMNSHGFTPAAQCEPGLKLQYVPFQKGVLTENVLAFLFCNDGAVAHCSHFPFTEHFPFKLFTAMDG